MTFFSNSAWWWPYFFILAGGWLATDIWRFIGVYFGGRMSEESEAMVLVRTMATALVAAVIGNLIVFPTGALADTSLAFRIGCAALGFFAYIVSGKRMLVGIVITEILLCIGLYIGL